MENKNLKPIVIGFVAVGILAILGYVFLKTPKVETVTKENSEISLPKDLSVKTPEASVTQASYNNPELGISFNYPSTWKVQTIEYFRYDPANPFLVLGQTKTSTVHDATIRARFISLGNKNPEEVMIQDVILDGIGDHPKSFDAFQLVKFGGNDYYKILTGTFEGVLGYKYYLVRDDGIFSFDFTAQGVPWSSPGFDPEKDLQKLELEGMLKTLTLAN